LNNLWDSAEFVVRRKELQLEALEWLAISSYHNYGFKAKKEDEHGQYGVRWHAKDAALHGANYLAKRDDVEL
jgi:hypothetical protein